MITLNNQSPSNLEATINLDKSKDIICQLNIQGTFDGAYLILSHCMVPSNSLCQYVPLKFTTGDVDNQFELVKIKDIMPLSLGEFARQGSLKITLINATQLTNIKIFNNYED